MKPAGIPVAGAQTQAANGNAATCRIALLLAAALGALCASGVIEAQDRDARRNARGGEVFQYWCAPCHAPGPQHPGTQALAVLYGDEKPAALEERNDLAPEITKTFVRTGVSVMPPFRKTEISDADLEALAAYLAP